MTAYEAFGLMYFAQAFLDHLEPSHDFDYSMTNSREKMFPSMLAMRMQPLNLRKSKGSHQPYYVTPN